jgi:hypothetical protein
MAGRTRHPLHSFLLFVLVCVGAWVAWQNRDFFKGSKEELLSRTQREELQEKILESLEREMCFHGLRGLLNWRPNEQRYLLDVELEDGEACEKKAREICEHIVTMIDEEAHVPATVIAYDRAGRELARRVR